MLHEFLENQFPGITHYVKHSEYTSTEHPPFQRPMVGLVGLVMSFLAPDSTSKLMSTMQLKFCNTVKGSEGDVYNEIFHRLCWSLREYCCNDSFYASTWFDHEVSKYLFKHYSGLVCESVLDDISIWMSRWVKHIVLQCGCLSSSQLKPWLE